MYTAVRQLLFLLPAETAHRLGIFALRVLSTFTGLCLWLRRRNLRGLPELSVTVAGLQFPSPVGLAAGLDKDAEAIPALFACGFGSVEVGTLTPRPQPGNPRPRLFRLPSDRAIINRMGFNNHGAETALRHLARLELRPGPVGINLGKNKDTPIEEATLDYLVALEQLAPYGDYFVVNASSPNTPGLRTLQHPDQLASLLSQVRAARDRFAPGRPLFLKIAPDLGPEAVDDIVDVAMAQKIDGLIATNTTLTRPIQHALANEAGGLSGAPLREAATAVIRRAYRRSGGKLPIIGVGGIFDARDAYEKIRAGASMVQIYSAFIYDGPPLVRELIAGLTRRLAGDGFQSVAEAVGIDAHLASPSVEAPRQAAK